MSKPFFSIFMPCYNHGKYVSVAIESILNQTFQDFELLVADNGSTDNSLEVINRYKDRVKVFHLDKNDPFGCCRMLVDECKGEYICQMAADDYWEEDKLELQAKEIKWNPDCIAYFTWAAFADENLNITNGNIFSYYFEDRYEWIRNIMNFGTILAINTVAMRNDKELYIKYMHNNVTQLWNLTDQREIINMLRDGQVSVVPKNCMKIRRSDNCIGRTAEDTIARTANETVAIWWDLWEKLDDKEFLAIFKDDIKNKEASSHLDVQCERMLVYLDLAESSAYHQNNAINYFISHYNDEGVAEHLHKVYGFDMKSFYEYTGKYGLVGKHCLDLHKKNIYVENEGKVLLGKKVRQITDMNLNICNSIIDKNSIDQKDVDNICAYYKVMAALKRALMFAEDDYCDISELALECLVDNSIEKLERILDNLQSVREITNIRFLQIM